MSIKFRALRADEVECRVQMVKGNGLTLLLYKDARVDQNVLDETVGPERWQKRYEVVNGNLFCSVGIRVFWEDEKKSEWIWKQDVGVESYSDKEKGEASDAFKRAAFCWGIGRELYTAPFIWIDAGHCKIITQDNNRYVCRDRFDVRDMEVADGKITSLTITNQAGAPVFIYGNSRKQEKATVPAAMPVKIGEAELKILQAELARTGVSEEQIKGSYKVSRLEDMTDQQYNSCKKRLAATKSREKAT